MKITSNLKSKVKAAKKAGTTHVASICSNHMTTDYFHFLTVGEILRAKNGDSLSYGRYNGCTMTSFYNAYPDGKVTRYQELFAA